MIKYNETINVLNKFQFDKFECDGGFINHINEEAFVCVICGRTTSLSMSTSNMGDKLVCKDCEIEVFKNDWNKLIEFQEKDKYAR